MDASLIRALSETLSEADTAERRFDDRIERLEAELRGVRQKRERLLKARAEIEPLATALIGVHRLQHWISEAVDRAEHI